MIYLCRACDAWVGIHDGTDKPLGRLANAELRDWKKRAHASFDPLWEAKMVRLGRAKVKNTKSKARIAGYKWLADKLSIPAPDCHNGMFDIETCKRVVEICDPYSLPLRRTPWYDGVPA